MSRLLTQAQFARKQGVDRSTVCKWVKEGKIPLSGKKIDPVEAEKALSANMSPRVMGLTKSKRKYHRRKSTMEQTLLNGEVTLTDARRQTELLKGELLSLKLQIARGDLISKKEPLEWFTAGFTMVRHAILNFPRRLAPALVSITDSREIEIILRKEAYSILRELTKMKHNGGVHDREGNEEKNSENHISNPRLGMASFFERTITTA